MRIFSTGGSDMSTWYRMWAATTAVYSVCGRQGRGGSSRGIGEISSIFRESRSLTSMTGGAGRLFITLSEQAVGTENASLLSSS